MKDLSILDYKIIAHRGIHNDTIKENTIEAFKKSISEGVPFELDIHIIKDGTLVVFHDRNLKRLYKKDIDINKLNYKKLSKLSNNEIVKLEDVLALTKGKVPIIIEIKKDDNKYKLEKKLVELMDNYEGKFAIKSFDMKSIAWFKKNRPEYVRGLLLKNKNYNLYDRIKLYFILKKIKPDFLSINYKLLNYSFINKYRKNNKILIWTINNDDKYNKYKNMCDSLICEKIDIKRYIHENN